MMNTRWTHLWITLITHVSWKTKVSYMVNAQNVVAVYHALNRNSFIFFEILNICLKNKCVIIALNFESHESFFFLFFCQLYVAASCFNFYLNWILWVRVVFDLWNNRRHIFQLALRLCFLINETAVSQENFHFSSFNSRKW